MSFTNSWLLGAPDCSWLHSWPPLTPQLLQILVNYFASFLCLFVSLGYSFGSQTHCCPWLVLPRDVVQLNELWTISAMARIPTSFSHLFHLPQVLSLQAPQDSLSFVLPPLPSGLEALWSSLDLPGIWRAKRNNSVWKEQAWSILSWVPRGGDLSTSSNYALPVVLHNRKKLGSSTESQGGSCQYNFPSLLVFFPVYVKMW